jgi:Arc/MetJ-type ribon-helix-helix transcriptional regulator
MATLSADVTPQMVKWIDQRVKSGHFKSRSEVIRALVREKMEPNPFPLAAASMKAWEKAWKDEDDKLWESYL